jgi:3-ketoacyl-CoA synthase
MCYKRICCVCGQVRVLLVKGHKPDLATAMDHILIHTGAAAVIASVADALRLGPEAAAPSKETLHHFGNTSVCSTYYILANIESRVRLIKRSTPS